MNVTTEQLFDHARTHNGFANEPIPAATLHQLYDLVKWGPTSANCSPARFIFVTTPEAKLRQLYDLVKWGPTSANCSPARFIFVTTPEAKAKLLGGMSPGNCS